VANSKKSEGRKTVDLYRDAGSGRIVSPEYANKHPKTTVHERNRKK